MTVERERDAKAKKALQSAIKVYADLESNLKLIFEVCDSLRFPHHLLHCLTNFVTVFLCS